MTTFGRFDTDSDDGSFLLTNPDTHRSWQLYLCNENLMTQLSQYAHGWAKYWNDAGQDVSVVPEGGAPSNRMLAIREPDGGVWSPAVFPAVTPPDDYQVRYSPAYWEASGAKNGIAASWRIFVPAREPLEIWTVRLTNRTQAPVTRDVFVYSPVALGGYCVQVYRFYASPRMFIQGHASADKRYVWIDNRTPHLPHDRFNAFLACSEPATSFDTCPEAFLGPAETIFASPAIRAGRCTDSVAYFGAMCMALHFRLTLAPGETRTLHFLEGVTSGPDHIEKTMARLLNDEAVEAELQAVVAARARERDASRLTSAAPALDSLVNIWAKAQNRLAVIHRKGFRDVLQDSAGMSTYDPERARAGIEEVLSVQRADGAGIRCWKPIWDKLEYSDGPYWLTLGTAAWIRETGDLSILDKSLPFLDGPPASVWEHLARGLDYLWHDRNARGLCRMRFADWNDGLDAIGKDGEGDSTMVTMSLVLALREIQHLARAGGKTIPYDAQARIDTLSDTLEKIAWRGEYYLRGFRDNGKPYGAPEEPYGSIYLNPQAWAILADLVPPKRLAALIAVTEKNLFHPYGFRLFHPSYPKYDPTIGRCSGELPGVYENGAVYNHAFAFFLQALFHAGEIGKVWQYLQILLPDSKANPSDRSGTEPFVLTNCVFTEEAGRRSGTSSHGWWTGTAAWVLRLVHNGLSGLTPEIDGLHAHPENIPAAMGLRDYARTFRGTRYQVAYARGKTAAVLADGKPVPRGKPLPLRPGSVVKVAITSAD